MQDHRDRLRKDRRGIMSLPIKLMVTALVISISLPLITNIMDDSERGMADAEMEQEIGKFMKAAELVPFRSVFPQAARCVWEGTGAMRSASDPYTTARSYRSITSRHLF